MDTKDKIVFCVLLLLSVGLLTLTYCVWNKQTELAHDILLCLIGTAFGLLLYYIFCRVEWEIGKKVYR